MPTHGQHYDQDFYIWTQEQAALLREGAWQDLDVSNLAEEQDPNSVLGEISSAPPNQ